MGKRNPQPPWPNGQGVGLLIRRLRVRVPQGVPARYGGGWTPMPIRSSAADLPIWSRERRRSVSTRSRLPRDNPTNGVVTIPRGSAIFLDEVCA